MKVSLNLITTSMLIGLPMLAQAEVFTIPQSSLIPSTTLWTDDLGISIGNTLVMTGGGSAANVGDPTGRNDDGFSGPISFGLDFSGLTLLAQHIRNFTQITMEISVLAMVYLHLLRWACKEQHNR